VAIAAWRCLNFRMFSVVRCVLARVRNLAARMWNALPSSSELTGALADTVRTRGDLLLENAVLRHQIVVLRRHARRPRRSRRRRTTTWWRRTAFSRSRSVRLRTLSPSAAVSSADSAKALQIAEAILRTRATRRWTTEIIRDFEHLRATIASVNARLSFTDERSSQQGSAPRVIVKQRSAAPARHAALPERLERRALTAKKPSGALTAPCNGRAAGRKWALIQPTDPQSDGSLRCPVHRR
jgi:hypothetical protein